jgi:hypothetical protein
MTKPLTIVTPGTIDRLAQVPGRHPVKDRKGLNLKVLKPAAGDKKPARRYWTYRYRFAGAETELSLGVYPDMTLKEAIAAHADKDHAGQGRRPAGN